MNSDFADLLVILNALVDKVKLDPDDKADCEECLDRLANKYRAGVAAASARSRPDPAPEVRA